MISTEASASPITVRRSAKLRRLATTNGTPAVLKSGMSQSDPVSVSKNATGFFVQSMPLACMYL
jgi:hypothetical protein